LTRRKRTKINIGDKFNRLTITKFIEVDKNNHKVFEALCDCGNYTKAKGTHMIQNNIKSCGCLFIETHRNSPGEAAFTHLYGRCKRNAKTKIRNYEFNLTYEEFKNIIIQNCYHCGEFPKKWNPYIKVNGSLKQNRQKTIQKDSIDRAWVSVNGVDRLDNNKGYILENSVPCCIPCNEAKMDRTLEEFLNHAKKIVAFQDKKYIVKYG
jgi:hypothetical protein